MDEPDVTTSEPAGNDALVASSIGLGAALTATTLGVGALVASMLRRLFDANWPNPVVAVGNSVIDWAPRPVKEWAIDTLGTRDKPALVIGTIVITLCAGVWVAWLWHDQRRRMAAGVVVVLGLIGAVCQTFGRGGSAVAALASTIAAASGLALLWLLSRPADVAESGTAPQANLSRRSAFIGVGGAAVGLAGYAASRRIDFNKAVAVARQHFGLPTAATPLPAEVAESNLKPAGVSPLYTPNADFYRIDTALAVPTIDPTKWTLSITGMVDRPLTLDFADLLDREMFEMDATIACVSNEVGGDLVGNARWLGTRLDDLLDEAGIDPEADQIMGVSTDGFTAGFPVAALDGRDAMVAVGMNGEPLPMPHGYPARLIVPGLYGYVSATKWLSEIRLTTFSKEAGYWIPRGWDVEAPVQVSSRIDAPRFGETLRAGDVAVGGVAWAPVVGIAKVEVRVDEGEWALAELGPDVGDRSWRQWWWRWPATAGQHALSVRATTNDDEVQTSTRVSPGPNAATGWHTIEVSVEG